MTLCHNDNWDNQPACRLIDGDPMSGSVRVNVELSSYILQKFGGCAACSPAKSSHTHISISYLSWQGGSLLGGALFTRQICRWGGILPCATSLACQAMAVGIAVFLSIYCG